MLKLQPILVPFYAALFVVLSNGVSRGETVEAERRSVEVDRDKQIHWGIPIAEQHHFAEFARVGFRHQLDSTVSRLTMPIGSRYIDVKVVVISQDGKRQEKMVHVPVEEREETFRLDSEGRKLRWSLTFFVSLSQHFDPLPAGKSTVEFSFPGDSMEVDGKPFTQESIVGPTADLWLEPFDATKVPPTPESDVRCVIRRFEVKRRNVYGKVFKNEVYPVVDLVNDSEDYIVIEGYVNASRPTGILCPINSETLRPVIGWQQAPGLAICGNGWGKLSIEPKTTQRIQTFALNGRGVSRLTIPYKERGEKPSSGVALSQPFVQTAEAEARVLERATK